jgi:predicted RNase H-like nuclease (RuvC/YqgF family)
MLTAFKSFLSSDREKELEQQVTDLNKENANLSKSIRDKDRQLKLHQEAIEEIRSHRPMSDEEWETFKNQSLHVTTLQSQLDTLALWLRNNKKGEIAAGLHNGMRLVDVVIGYLSRGTVIPVKIGGGDGEKVN